MRWTFPETRGRSSAPRPPDERVARGGDGGAASAEAVDRAEAALFLDAVADVRPLPSANDPGPPRTPQASRPARDDEAEALRDLDAIVQGEQPFDIADTGEHMEGLARGVDRRHLLKLRRGEYAVQANLDLHGLRRGEAWEAVARFIADSRRLGHRCVLIVHGRGRRSPEGPVLKEGLKAWLARGRTGRTVMAFATAQSADGGAGALYVLLRR